MIYSNNQCGIAVNFNSYTNFIQENDLINNMGCLTQITDKSPISNNNAYFLNYLNNTNGLGNVARFSPTSNANQIIQTTYLLPNSNVFDSEVVLIWNASYDLFDYSIKYDLSYSLDDGVTWTNIATNLASTIYDWILPNLTIGTKMTIKVTSINSFGLQSSYISSPRYYKQIPVTSTTQPSDIITGATIPPENLVTASLTLMVSLVLGGGVGAFLAMFTQRMKLKKL